MHEFSDLYEGEATSLHHYQSGLVLSQGPEESTYRSVENPKLCAV